MENGDESRSLKNSLQINSNLADKITLLFNNLNQITNNIVNIETSTEVIENENKNDFYQKEKSDEIFIKPTLLSRENTGDFKHTIESFENERKDTYNEKEKLDFLIKKNENFNLDIETSLKNISNSFSFNKDNKDKINYDYSEISDHKQSNYLNLSKNTHSHLKEDLLNSDVSKQNVPKKNLSKEELIINKEKSFHELVNTGELPETDKLVNTEEIDEDKSMDKFYKNLRDNGEIENDKNLSLTNGTNITNTIISTTNSKSIKMGTGKLFTGKLNTGKFKRGGTKSYKSVHDLIENLEVYKERGIKDMTCFDLEQYHKNMEIKIRKNLINYRFKN